MAGSYGHIVTPKGNLVSNETFTGMIENLGDAYEMTEEMYGMIWFLVYSSGTDDPAAMVEDARKKYKEGLKFSKMIHRRRA